MGAEPVEGLLAHLVVAEGALLRQDAAAVSSGETASRHGETVDQGDPRVLADPVEQMTPQPLFEDPKVGHLAREGGAVHSAQSREPLAVVTSKVGVKVLLGVYPQELAHHLMVKTSESQSSGVGPHWRGGFCPWTQSSVRQKTATMKVLRSRTSGDLLYAGCLESPPSVAGVSVVSHLLRETCTRG